MSKEKEAKMKIINYRICDLRDDIANRPNQIEKLTLDKVGDIILGGIYKRNCEGCFNEKECHESVTKCDEMTELLENIGFEI